MCCIMSILHVNFLAEEQDQDESIQEDDGDVAGDKKFIFFKSQLLILFRWCRTFGLEVELKASTVGTMLVVYGMCCDGHIRATLAITIVCQLVTCCWLQLYYSVV